MQNSSLAGPNESKQNAFGTLLSLQHQQKKKKEKKDKKVNTANETNGITETIASSNSSGNVAASSLNGKSAQVTSQFRETTPNGVVMDNGIVGLSRELDQSEEGDDDDFVLVTNDRKKRNQKKGEIAARGKQQQGFNRRGQSSRDSQSRRGRNPRQRWEENPSGYSDRFSGPGTTRGRPPVAAPGPFQGRHQGRFSKQTPDLHTVRGSEEENWRRKNPEIDESMLALPDLRSMDKAKWADTDSDDEAMMMPPSGNVQATISSGKTSDNTAQDQDVTLTESFDNQSEATIVSEDAEEASDENSQDAVDAEKKKNDLEIEEDEEEEDNEFYESSSSSSSSSEEEEDSSEEDENEDDDASKSKENIESVVQAKPDQSRKEKKSKKPSEKHQKLSKAEKRKKELEELDALLTKLDTQSTQNEEPRAKASNPLQKKTTKSTGVEPSIEDAVSEALAQLTGSQDLTSSNSSAAANKKNKKKKNKKKTNSATNSAQTDVKVETGSSQTHNPNMSEEDVRRLAAAKASKKKKPPSASSGATTSAEKTAIAEAKARQEKLKKKKKKKEKGKFEPR